MKIYVILPLLLSSACASIVSGSTQSLSVDTPGHSGAQCQMQNDDGTWFVSSTPGSVMVHRSASDMTVNCKKDTLAGSTAVHSSTKGMAFGNILAGGIIGAAVDMSDGAAYDYPVLIQVAIQEGGIYTPPPPAPEKKKEASSEYPTGHQR